MTALRVDLNCDAGEGYGPWRMGDDAALLDVVTSVNIACGFHAGDPLIMAATVAAARARGVGVGAHPGHNDRWGFGRRAIPGVRPVDLAVMVAYQVGALQAVAAVQGARVGHVKLHGALNNQAAVDEDLATVLAEAVRGVDASLLWLAPSGSAMARAGEAVGLRVAHEVFADRAYDDAGNLVGRDRPGAVIEDPDEVAARAVRMVVDGAVESMSGRPVRLRADTVCVHGDNPAAVAAARATRSALEHAGVSVEPLVATR